MLPTPNPTVTFQVWDKDVIGSDDYISSVTMDFSPHARNAFENDISVKMFGKKSLNLLSKVTSLFSGSKKDEETKKEKEESKKETKLEEGEKFDLDLNSVDKEGVRNLGFFEI